MPPPLRCPSPAGTELDREQCSLRVLGGAGRRGSSPPAGVEGKRSSIDVRVPELGRRGVLRDRGREELIRAERHVRGAAGEAPEAQRLIAARHGAARAAPECGTVRYRADYPVPRLHSAPPVAFCRCEQPLHGLPGSPEQTRSETFALASGVSSMPREGLLPSERASAAPGTTGGSSSRHGLFPRLPSFLMTA
jgi:hypothetical protein